MARDEAKEKHKREEAEKDENENSAKRRKAEAKITGDRNRGNLKRTDNRTAEEGLADSSMSQVDKEAPHAGARPCDGIAMSGGSGSSGSGGSCEVFEAPPEATSFWHMEGKRRRCTLGVGMTEAEEKPSRGHIA